MKQRKHIRLKEYDYSNGGYYFITICTQDKKKILGSIVGRWLDSAEKNENNVGRGLASAKN